MWFGVESWELFSQDLSPKKSNLEKSNWIFGWACTDSVAFTSPSVTRGLEGASTWSGAEWPSKFVFAHRAEYTQGLESLS